MAPRSASSLDHRDDDVVEQCFQDLVQLHIPPEVIAKVNTPCLLLGDTQLPSSFTFMHVKVSSISLHRLLSSQQLPFYLIADIFSESFEKSKSGYR